MSEPRLPLFHRSTSEIESSLDLWVTGAQHWTRLTLGPGGVSAVASALSLLGISLILRSLSDEEAGAFALLQALVQTIGLVAAMGFPTVVTRRYSRPIGNGYDWRRDTAGTVVFAMAPLTGAIVLARLAYELPEAQLAFLFGSGAALVVLWVFSSMLSASGHYTWSSLIVRVPSALLLPIGLGSLFLPALRQLNTVIILQLAGTGVTVILASYLMAQLLPRTGGAITLRERLQGIPFLLSSAILLIPDHVVVALGGAILTAPQLATYAAIAVLLRPFRLIRAVLSMVMMPELIKRQRQHYWRLAVGLWGLAIAAALAAILLTPLVARWFYAGKYQEGYSLVPLLALAGVAHLTSVLPKSHLYGTAQSAFLNRFISAQVAGLGAALLVGGVLIARLGTVGLALAVILAETSVTTISYVAWWRLRTANRPSMA